MAILNEDNALVLVIDVQEKLLNAVFNKEQVEKNTEILAKICSILDLPTFVTEQYPKGLGATVSKVADNLSECVKYFEKTAFNALEDENLLELLRGSGRKQVVLFGIETHICVHQTAASLIDKGFEVFVIMDASSSRTEVQHQAGLNRMKENGANITTTEIALFELLKTAKHPHFKTLQALIK